MSITQAFTEIRDSIISDSVDKIRQYIDDDGSYDDIEGCIVDMSMIMIEDLQQWLVQQTEYMVCEIENKIYSRE